MSDTEWLGSVLTKIYERGLGPAAPAGPRGCENRERWWRRALFLEDEELHPRWSSRGRHPDREFVP